MKLGPTGLDERVPSVKWQVLPSSKSTSFRDSVETIYWDCESFLGKPFFNELNFYYKKSKTFLCADTFWNYPTASLPNYYGQGDVGTIHLCSKVSLPFQVVDEGKNIEANKVSLYSLTFTHSPSLTHSHSLTH
jgi:hypothetical protein